jgi:hypothetical protein
MIEQNGMMFITILVKTAQFTLQIIIRIRTYIYIPQTYCIIKPINPFSLCNANNFFHWLYNAPWALASDFQFHDHFTDGRTSWTSDQLIARPINKHRTTQTE